METVTHVAYRLSTGRIISARRPARHSALRTKDALAVPGFLTSEGRFLNREQARAVAEAAGQIVAGAVTSRWLYSEDVW